ncbi:hypothetical protein YC2023_019572 [Brassica napus]
MKQKKVVLNRDDKAPPKEPSLLKPLSREDGTTTSSILLQVEPPDQSPNRQAMPLDAPIKLPNQEKKLKILEIFPRLSSYQAGPEGLSYPICYTVSRSKSFEGGGNVTGTETVPEQKLSQISNNCHNCLN